ncbi:glycosyl transferase family 1 [Niveispirillum sp.]|uniref:O-linked N-acetylglucosamine transferase, SPINDLY family protein n=1 Tax=Niveispirillum sp. TaxID=1917217 RepID=UPI001B7C2E97|nr:glycosyl transferase family 1 [Niveispirillum sp.]MBP7334806.1 tetratricopeptide repeat protein [Niveispirillum sp.]
MGPLDLLRNELQSAVPSAPDAERMARWLGWLRTLSVPDMLTLAVGMPDTGRPWLVEMLHAWLQSQGSGTPGAGLIWFNLGVELSKLDRPVDAATAYQNALLLRPDLWQAAVNLANLREAAGDAAGAAELLGRALQEDRGRTLLLTQRGRLLEDQRRLAEAENCYYRSLLTDPDQPDVVQHWAFVRQNICAWPVFGPPVPGRTPDELRAQSGALATLSLIGTVEGQRRAVSDWLDRRLAKMPTPTARLAPPDGYAHDRLRIGYLSSDFCRHPMSFLMAELLERHDRSRVEVYGYCSSPEDGSDIRARVLAALDHRRLVGKMPDEAVARLIRSDEIDVLIDLNGVTAGDRLGVLRWKPAPVQATYLGFIGPVPVPELDYILTDDYAIPPHLAGAYWPRPLYLPGVYQANDSRPLPLPPVSRAQEGLPQDRFVFCCFSNAYKISDTMFDGWMEILGRAPGSVLWLLADNEWAAANMRARATRMGIDADRLIMAGRTDPARYRARMALADLFLDTTPYNAGTIASDALRVGLPLLTLSGETFASRMAGSLLHAMGVPELITLNLPDYVDQAVRHASDPAWHAAIRARTSPDQWHATLGDTGRFSRLFEETLERVAIRR